MTDISSFMRDLAVLAPPFLLAITLHELAHGLVAYRLGDPTAQRQGRLTMNPLKHLDLWGTLAFFIVKIGWARPIPVDARYFKNPRQDMMRVAFAGAGANLLLAVASALFARLLTFGAGLVPYAILLPVAQMAVASVWINIMLGIFNLLPIPPLDGAKILQGLLPVKLAADYRKIEPFGFIILLLLFYTGIIPRLIMPLIRFAQSLLLF